jgi:hypothetical protein
MTDIDTPRCSDCGTGLGELHADRTGDVLCFRCNLKRYPDEIVEAPIEAPSRTASKRNTPGQKFKTRPVDLTQLRPVRFTWKPWLVHGRLNLLAGEESVGKSTLQAWIVAKATRGELADHPVRVLFVGADEDSWNEVTAPRLYALGADLSMVGEFVPVDDATIFNVVDHARELDRELRVGKFGLVVFEQLMDVLPALKNSTEPMEIRRALRPLRRVLAARDVTGLGTLHVNKAQADQLRQRMQGSMQFNALSRSTILVDRHPGDTDRRIAVLGKANYVAGSVAMSFRIEGHRFDLNGREFDVGRVADVQADNTSIGDVLAQGRGRRDLARDRKRDEVLLALADGPLSEMAVVKRTGIPRSTVKRILLDLEADESAERTAAGWGVHLSTSLGNGHVDTTGNGHVDSADRWTCEQCGALLEVDEETVDVRCLNGHRQKAPHE